MFDPQSVGDLRFQIADLRVVVRTNNDLGPGIDITGLVNFGRPYDNIRIPLLDEAPDECERRRLTNQPRYPPSLF